MKVRDLGVTYPKDGVEEYHYLVVKRGTSWEDVLINDFDMDPEDPDIDFKFDIGSLKLNDRFKIVNAGDGSNLYCEKQG